MDSESCWNQKKKPWLRLVQVEVRWWQMEGDARSRYRLVESIKYM